MKFLVALGATGAVLEGGLRFAGFAPREEAPYVFSRTKGWDLRPSTEEVNALGFRGREIGEAKPPGTRRLAVLGDSFTYGLGVGANETYPAVLEGLLRDPGRAVEVVNAGVPGYGTVQEAIHLEEKVLPLAPDEVLLGFFPNDVQPWSPPLPRPLGLAFLAAERSSATLHFFRRMRVRFRFRSVGYRSEMDLLEADRIGREGDPEWGRCREALARMAGACRERDIAFRLVVWPHLRLMRDYPFSAAHEAVGRVAQEIGIPCLDLRALFADSNPEDVLASIGNPHPNAATHARAARAIAEWLATPR